MKKYHKDLGNSMLKPLKKALDRISTFLILNGNAL